MSLNYLLKIGAKPEEIDVIVSDIEEAAKYMEILRNTNVNIYCPKTEITTVKEKFNYIHSHYAPGTRVLVMEDDITSIHKLAGYNLLEECTDFLTHAYNAFEMCEEHGTKLWGISSNNNPFFLRDHVGPCFKLICANVYGFIAETPAILNTEETKTDYERTILYTIKYGCVIRIDNLCPMTKNYKTEGGMQDIKEKRAEMEEVATGNLAAKYPELCKRNTGKDSQYAELSLRTIKVTPNNKNSLF